MSPTRRQTKRDIQKKHLLQPARVVRISPKLRMLIENVGTMLKGVNHKLVFPAGVKMLICGH